MAPFFSLASVLSGNVTSSSWAFVHPDCRHRRGHKKKGRNPDLLLRLPGGEQIRLSAHVQVRHDSNPHPSRGRPASAVKGAQAHLKHRVLVRVVPVAISPDQVLSREFPPPAHRTLPTRDVAMAIQRVLPQGNPLPFIIAFAPGPRFVVVDG
eukprot:CAMPEP_0183295862 /NCGR_PEP_ID=MMETSP0160_2-20130417/3658_1 /TAXON_ID=2839 ORGANISM="Odontella Sinensis, Strain Grunow 1884" /NCGR_SAMPLE_ID=MMETSP0160_2 /ASSEMBLY_ACC=CAM_ASM_000250 /LENGTH=151 /DNA_ID=CAMNT_0025457401 /DNA_START=502 /DNA_END=954 /DNA_ORIENTATION=+